MKSAPEAAPAKPVASRIEAKNELTTKAAKLIIDGEVAKRVAKTDRLRALRLEQEAADAVAAAAEPKKAAGKAKAPAKKLRKAASSH